MVTTILWALLVGSACLVGCSGGDESPSAGPSTTAPIPGGPAADSGGVPCAAPGTAGDPTLPLSPVAMCRGYFTTSGFGAAWLHRTPTGCMWGTALILGENGAVTELEGSKRSGSWEGDEYHFTVSLGQSRYGFNREPTK